MAGTTPGPATSSTTDCGLTSPAAGAASAAFLPLASMGWASSTVAPASAAAFCTIGSIDLPKASSWYITATRPVATVVRWRMMRVVSSK